MEEVADVVVILFKKSVYICPAG